MKIKVIYYLLFVTVFLSFGFISAHGNHVSNCTDTDSGIDYWLKGTVIDSAHDSIYEDTCTTLETTDGSGGFSPTTQGKILQEFYCGEHNYQWVFYECPNGCQEGACRMRQGDECIDTDGGEDYFRPGIVYCGLNAVGLGDACDYLGNPNGVLKEAIIVDGQPAFIDVMCLGATPYCNKGVCSSVPPICVDTDGGKNIYEKGTVTSPRHPSHDPRTDYCANEFGEPWYDYNCFGAGCSPCIGKDCFITEFYCGESDLSVRREIIPCPEGCVDGKCVSLVIPENDKPVGFPVEKDQSPTTQRIIDDLEYVCNGCLLENKCYPFGYRKNENFCSDNTDFIPQLQQGDFCENNFECSSGICIDDNCVSASIWKKFLEWFNKFFGSD